jgi:hypothetical protein
VRLQLQRPAVLAAATATPGAAAAAATATLPTGALAMAAQLSLRNGAANSSSSTTGFTLPSTAWAVRGLSATLGRDVVPHGVWFAAYEGAKRGLASETGGSLSAASQVRYCTPALAASRRGYCYNRAAAIISLP